MFSDGNASVERRPYTWLPVLIFGMAIVAAVIGVVMARSIETSLVEAAGENLTLGAAEIAGAPAGQIYGVKVESEMSLRTVDFPLDTASYDERSRLSADEVETVVRETGAILTDGAVQVAALHYVVGEFLDRDPFLVAPEELAGVRCATTLVAGRPTPGARPGRSGSR